MKCNCTIIFSLIHHTCLILSKRVGRNSYWSAPKFLRWPVSYQTTNGTKKICSSLRQRPRNWNATLRLTNTQVLGSCDNRTDLGIYGWGDKRNYSELIIILSLWIVYVILNHVSTLSRLSALLGLYWKSLTIALTQLNGSPTFEWNFCAPGLVRCAKHLKWCMDVSVTALVILAALSVDTAMDLCMAAGNICSSWSWCECISWSVWSSPSLPAVYREYENHSHSL